MEVTSLDMQVGQWVLGEIVLVVSPKKGSKRAALGYIGDISQSGSIVAVVVLQ